MSGDSTEWVFTPEPLEDQSGAAFSRLVAVMQRLLAPDGCPWDREQDERSLSRYVLEEACEVLDAIDEGDDAALCEELGDLALQIAFLGELGRRRRAFGPDDIFAGICEKLVRRHPHVFGDQAVRHAADVERNWERIKQLEKGKRRLLDGIPRHLPALERAHQMSTRAARVGFDWPSAEQAKAKVFEELGELDAAVDEADLQRRNEEFGDLLFALVNWARHLEIEPELALRQACDKFARRFAHVEQRVEQQGGWPRDERGKPTRGIELPVLDSFWEESKRGEPQIP